MITVKIFQGLVTRLFSWFCVNLAILDTWKWIKIYCLDLIVFGERQCWCIQWMQNHIWLNVLKICSTTSKLQWSSPKHAFCLRKLSEDILQVSLIFCSFLSKILAASLWQSLPNRSWAPLASLMSSSTLAQLSFTDRLWKCWGWSNHSWCRASTTTTTATSTTTSSSAKLAPGPARHELAHLRILILGEVGLATMQDHGAVLLLNCCGHHLVFLHHSMLASFPGITVFPQHWWNKVMQ